MKGEHMLMYALVFVLGFMVARMMGGRLIEGGQEPGSGVDPGYWCETDEDCSAVHPDKYCDKTRLAYFEYFNEAARGKCCYLGQECSTW